MKQMHEADARSTPRRTPHEARSMKPLIITASTLVSACGVGWRATAAALAGQATPLRRNDFAPALELDTWIGRVDAVEAALLPAPLAAYDCRVNRLACLALEQDGFAAAVARARARYGDDRVGVFVGTSTSGMLATELAVRERRPMDAFDVDHRERRHSMHAPARLVCDHLRLGGVAQSISTACSSSAKVFAAAARAIAMRLCDAAVVGGADSLALSTLHGFRALGLLSRHACRPCDVRRDGISIGEAAGFALLEPQGEGAVALTGCGESVDAWHMSAPHPEGAGASRAMLAAIADASLRPEHIGYVNLHGTATPANDAAEDIAVSGTLPHRPPASSTKGFTGHALGAAGIVEALLTAFALERQWIPPTFGCRHVDPAFRSRIALQGGNAAIEHALSNSFGFGGNNCSLVLSRVQ
jgi:3-oxoacyl-[acyl-carrier-protein] synthase-1